MVFEDVDFVSFLDWFADIGGFEIILPFLLIFAVTFAILDKINIFGANKKNINIVLAIIMGFFFIVQGELVEIMLQFIPKVSMLILTVIMILLVMGIFGYGFGESWKGLSVIVALVGVLWALAAGANWDVPLVDWFTEDDVAILLMIGIFILVIWFVVSGPKQQGQDSVWKGIKGFFDGLGKELGGGSSKSS